MKKRLIVTFALLLLIPAAMFCMLTGCNKDGGDGEETTVTTAPKGDPIGSEMVNNKSLGFFAYGEITSDNDYVADATVRRQGDGVSVKVYSNGTANLTVKDYWGNTATISITVENSEISSVNVTPFDDANSVNVRFMGAYGTGNVDDTKAFQAAIDSLPNGGNVYVPAGSYKIQKLVLRENITLWLQGKVDDVAAGYTDEVAQRVANQEFAVLEDASFVNHEIGGAGNTGASNIAIIGGMIDYNGAAATKTQIDVNWEGPAEHPESTATGCIAISCGSNYRFENIIIKDCYNSHAFQICGASDLVIKDCMFAGYMGRANTKGSVNDIVTNRETIQIEYAHSGAIPPSTFESGEFYFCKNIKIEGCYFGDSDKSGYHVTAIGQHGQNGTANVDGLVVEGCVFDNPYYCAMRFPNYTNVTIKNNKFISNTKGHIADSNFLSFYMQNSDKTYDGKTASGLSRTIVSAHAYEHDGLHNFEITGNQFIITGDSITKVISAVSTNLTQGARTISNVMRKVDGQFYGSSYTGFIKCTNFISDINFSDNSITVDANNYTAKYVALFDRVTNLTVNNNSVVTSNGVSLTYTYNNTAGIQVKNEVSAAKANQFDFVTALTNRYILLDDGKGGIIKIASSSSAARTLSLIQVEHAKIQYTIDSSYNVVVSVVCDEGYTFSGWTKSGVAYNPGSSVSLSSDLTLTAVCTSK